MAQFRFASVLRPESRAFLFDESDNESFPFRGRKLCEGLLDYPTFGDGLIQHGNEVPVNIEDGESLRDAIASLLCAVRFDVALRSAVATKWARYVHNEGDDVYRWYASLKYTEGKPLWYSRCKTSRSNSKRHDKRWELVPECAVGGWKSAADLVIRNGWYPTLSQQYAIWERARRVCGTGNDHTGNWMEHFRVNCNSELAGYSNGFDVGMSYLHGILTAQSELDNLLYRSSNWTAEKLSARESAA